MTEPKTTKANLSPAQVEAMMKVWSEWASDTPGLRETPESMLCHAFYAAFDLGDMVTLDEEKANIQQADAALIEADKGQVTAADAGYEAGWNAALDAADIKIRDYLDRREPSSNAWLTQKALVENILTSLEKETA